MNSERLDAIERLHRVVIDVSDNSGTTFVYAYTEDGDRIAFEFNSMDPDIGDVEAVSAAISAIRQACNKRPRIGRLSVLE